MTIDEIKELMETGGEFTTEEYKGQFRYNQIKGKLEICVSEQWYGSGIEFNELLSATLICKPWKPKIGEVICFWAFWNGKWLIDVNMFVAEENHLALIAFGNCFRTREECNKHTEVRDKLIEMRKGYIE